MIDSTRPNRAADDRANTFMPDEADKRQMRPHSTGFIFPKPGWLRAASGPG